MAVREDRRAAAEPRGSSADLVARDTAQKALGRIEAHEILCTERWGQVHETTKRIEATVNSVRSLMWKAGAGVIAALLSLSFFLASRLP